MRCRIRAQDANECWTELMRVMQQKLAPHQPSASNEVAEGAKASRYSNFIDQYFGGVFQCTMKNTESEDEPVTKSTENFLQLSCFISQGKQRELCSRVRRSANNGPSRCGAQCITWLVVTWHSRQTQRSHYARYTRLVFVFSKEVPRAAK